MTRSLYLHIPFCEHRCHYCDFYSIGQDKLKPNTPSPEDLLSALETELTLYKDTLHTPLDTLFWGGGTPSSLDEAQFTRLAQLLHSHKLISPETEWTMECNPNSLTPTKLKLYRELGVNRLSIGVQSLDPKQLKWMERVHSKEQAFTALENAFSAGFKNVSADLICGLPDSDIASQEASLNGLLSFPLTHLSCYLLTLHAEHVSHAKLPPDETQLEQLLFVHDRMNRAGFQHYETSNFCKPGREARHNLVYWTGRSYLGLGPSAHSHSAPRRWKNHSSLRKYCEDLKQGRKPLDFTETLSAEQIDIEKWMLALRLDRGFPTAWLDSPERKTSADKLSKQGLLEPHPTQPDTLRPTPRGLFLGDTLAREFI